MKNISMKLINCFWIKSLEHNFQFPQENDNNPKVISIYAKNWVMKTSFLKVFEKYQKNVPNEIRDNIFWYPSEHNITIDWEPITPSQIFTLGQVDEKYQSWHIATLLIRQELKAQFENILHLKHNLLSRLRENTGLQIPSSPNAMEISPLEKKILADFQLPEDNFLASILQIELPNQEELINFDWCLYKDIFDNGTVENMISSAEFQGNISNFLQEANNIFNDPQYSYLSKGHFSFGQFQLVAKSLEENNFFYATWNALCLAGNNQNREQLNAQITQIEEVLHSTPAFVRIREKLNTTIKWQKVISLLETIPNLVEHIQDFENFRKQLWYKYISEITDEDGNIIFNEIKTQYQDLISNVNALDDQDTERHQALNVFNDRFHMPFQMKIANRQNVIFGEIPVVEFEFRDEENWNEILKKQSEISDTLSQWEKRALFLLNMIFDLEKIKKDIEDNPNQEVVIIVDDIADSFDYRNKYAIIEYLQEFGEIDWLYMIVLTHNYDFFRCINNRFRLTNPYTQMVKKGENWSLHIDDSYNEEPWKQWKNEIIENIEENEKKKYFVALIPFVRNLIEYGKNDDNKFRTLTHLLHWKQQQLDGIPATQDISFQDLVPIYEEYLWVNIQFENADQSIYLFLEDMDITWEDTLENKILYAILIRLYAEQIMIREISLMNPSAVPELSQNQLGRLYRLFKNSLNTLPTHLSGGRARLENIQRILNKVCIMTPESIHFNSFMYEPIIDMDIVELQDLYSRLQDFI